MSTLRAQIKNLPRQPGVYLFKDSTGAVLYVGKAISLRERVRSYFAKEIGRGPGIDRMVQEATRLDHEVTGSEMEALLLEARLIRQYKPKYNIKLRDDKSFSLIRIDLSEPFPPIYLSREKELEELLLKRKRERGAVNKVSQKIDNQEFFGPYLSASSVKLVLKTIRPIWPFRDCSESKYRTYQRLGHGCIFHTLHLCDAPCADGISQEEYRKNIDQIRAFLRGERTRLLSDVQTQMEQAALQEHFELAAKYRDRLQSLIHIQSVAQTRRSFAHVSDYNPEADLRVECFDISNIQGAYAVGSQIVGIIRRGKSEPVRTREEAKQRFYLDRSRYRKFRVKTVEGISDVDMLREVLTRRLRRAKNGEERWLPPDLLIVDGGKGQLNVAETVRSDLQLDLLVGAVAKGPTRRRVDLHGKDWQKLPLVEREAWPVIAELLREEAHRFAIAYYRSRHRHGLTAG